MKIIFKRSLTKLRFQHSESQMDHRDPEHPMNRLGSLPVQISARVCGRSLKLDEFLSWTPGTVLSFDHSASVPLAVCIGGQNVGEGEAVKVGSKFGVRLLRIGAEPVLKR